MKEKEFKSEYKKVGNKILNYPGHHSVAAISHNVEICYTISFDEKNQPHINYSSDSISATVTLSDCNKVVNLNFDIDELQDERNSLYKINSLIEELTVFRASLKEAIAHRDEHIKELGKPFGRKDKRKVSKNTAKALIEAHAKSKNKSKGKVQTRR